MVLLQQQAHHFEEVLIPAHGDAILGDAAEPRTFGPITRTDIVRYAGASGDFNPIHWNEEFAKSAGYPGVFAQGMFTAGVNAITQILFIDSYPFLALSVFALNLVFVGIGVGQIENAFPVFATEEGGASPRIRQPYADQYSVGWSHQLDAATVVARLRPAQRRVLRMGLLEGMSHWIPEEAPQAVAEAVVGRVHGTDAR